VSAVRGTRPAVREEGFSIIEVLVGMVLIGVVAALGISTVLATQRSTATTVAEADGVEEARLAMNRMTRELRQARELLRVINPDGPAYDATALTAVTFEADFDDDGCIDGVTRPGDTGGCLPDDPSEPEVITYCHQPASASNPEPQLFVVRGALPAGTVTACTGGEPILAEDVAAFQVQYRSNAYRHDLSPADGTTTWRELDAAPPPTGNDNDVLDVELQGVTSVAVLIDLQNPGLQLRTQVALRNRV
jgi:prepilin-type N-terminal cleavage/methylation domain-containing protein